MNSYSVRRAMVSGLAAVLAATTMSPAFASNITDDVREAVEQKFDRIPVVVLPTEKPDAVKLRGGPVSNQVANEVSLAVAKIPGVNEIINEMLIEQ